jgi:putative chitinase
MASSTESTNNKPSYQCLSPFQDAPGPRYREVAKHSHYNEPINSATDQGIIGRSRRAGDLSREDQFKVASELVNQARVMNYSEDEIAFALAVAKVESGFNPDAAAGTTSASGIGQLTDRTGAKFGLDASNRFDFKANIKAMLGQLRDDLSATKKNFEQAYARYHDGPTLKYGGKEIAQTKVVPLVDDFKQWLKNCL